MQYNVVLDRFCLQLKKPTRAYIFVKYNFLFITKCRVILPRDTDNEEVSKSLEYFILTYKNDVNNITEIEVVRFKKYWAYIPSYNDTKDYMLDILKIFNDKKCITFFSS